MQVFARIGILEFSCDTDTKKQEIDQEAYRNLTIGQENLQNRDFQLALENFETSEKLFQISECQDNFAIFRVKIGKAVCISILENKPGRLTELLMQIYMDTESKLSRTQ